MLRVRRATVDWSSRQKHVGRLGSQPLPREPGPKVRASGPSPVQARTARSNALGVVWVAFALGLMSCVPEERPGDSEIVPALRSLSPAPSAALVERFRAVPRPRVVAPKSSAPGSSPSSSQDPALLRPFLDDFERGRLGRNYQATSSAWRVEDGRLCGEAAKNHPIWLKRRLPTNVRIEFDAVSESDEGDIKVEVFGDGQAFAKKSSYTDATSYLLIYGGWHNSRHVLARLDEHAPGRLETLTERNATTPRLAPVVRGKTYRFKVERRDGQRLGLSVDAEEIHGFNDPQPLKGPGHEYFAFNTWQAKLCFDNLKLVPLGN